MLHDLRPVSLYEVISPVSLVNFAIQYALSLTGEGQKLLRLKFIWRCSNGHVVVLVLASSGKKSTDHLCPWHFAPTQDFSLNIDDDATSCDAAHTTPTVKMPKEVKQKSGVCVFNDPLFTKIINC